MSSTFPWRIAGDPGIGNIARGHISWDDDQLTGRSYPFFAIHGTSPGPAVALTAGIHGGEYPGPVGAIACARNLNPERVNGSILILPMINLSSFWERTAFITPEDVENLNRKFPGSPDGSFTQLLAYRLMQDVIGPADILIDLHSGDVFETLADHVGYYAMSGGLPTESARVLAGAFNVPLVLRSPAPKPPGASITSAAVLAGKAVVYAEIGCNGLLREADEETVHRGLANALRAVAELEGQAISSPYTVCEPAGSVQSRVSGLWRPDETPGKFVVEGDLLGIVTDFFGESIKEIRSPTSGFVLYFLSSLAAREGDTLVSLARYARN